MKLIKNNVIYLSLAFLISFVWVLFSKDYYSYNHNFWVIWQIDLFPLIMWGIGLFIIYKVYLFLCGKFKLSSKWEKIIFFLLFYWFVLVMAETIGYHFFNVHNMPTANYSGLPICQCMHAPAWMKVSYFLLGPIYYFICEVYKLRNN